ncbi:hypothetical protein E2562_000928 [Oryza meyeriana var. granulata]|uniref:Uncharacterized protein n=1 Tax=Oryza meyeriana var. granulata TaxID=110450 RepID=A0A6G1CYD9_9ORYZ|nr:hypothetical protein E2562_000928 [Oryza meyeriana var. granulata]
MLEDSGWFEPLLGHCRAGPGCQPGTGTHAGVFQQEWAGPREAAQLAGGTWGLSWPWPCGLEARPEEIAGGA